MHFILPHFSLVLSFSICKTRGLEQIRDNKFILHVSSDPLLELHDHCVQNSEAKAGLGGKEYGHQLATSACAQGYSPRDLYESSL